ncbi:MAG: DUF4836 family protein [Dysgonamonadaceae bacterium]|jgi:hypothetical protein|nr:DUF4836 family protein [Dysgonamonadaceae bacterium]
MKLYKNLFFVFLAGVMLFSSCKEETTSQLSVIPSNATFVVAFEAQKMVQKGGLNKLPDYKLFQKVQGKMASMDTGIQKFIDEFLKDPKSSGLDFEKIYVYGVKEGDGFYCSANFKMDNRSTFEKKMTELSQIQGQNLPEVEDKGDYKIIDCNEVIIAWNDNLLQLSGGDLSAFDHELLFNLPSDKSILSVADFAAFQKKPYDIGFWMSYGEFLKLMEQMSGVVKMPSYLNEFADSYVHSYVNFEDGELKALVRMSPQSKVDEFVKKYPVIKKESNTALLEDFPEKSYLLTKLSVNWEEYLKLMMESLSQMQMPSGANPSYLQILEDPTVKTLFDIIEGDMLFSIYNLAQGPLPLPLAGLSFTLKNDGDFERLLALFPEEMLKQSGDYYVISTPFMIGIYIGYKDKRVLITDDADAIASFTGKGFSPNLKSNPMAEILKKSPALVYMNLDLETYPENLRTLLQNISPEVNMGLSVLKPFKDMSYYANEKGEVIFSLKFKDSKQNSLKTILKLVDDTAFK